MSQIYFISDWDRKTHVQNSQFFNRFELLFGCGKFLVGISLCKKLKQKSECVDIITLDMPPNRTYR